MNNRFDENKEFVRRPSVPRAEVGQPRQGQNAQRTAQPHQGQSTPQPRPGQNVPRTVAPTSGVRHPSAADVRPTMPQGRGTVGTPSARTGAAHSKSTFERGRTASMPSEMHRENARAVQHERKRIAPDGTGGNSRIKEIFSAKNLLIFFGMLAGLLLIVGFAVFTFLGASKETPRSESKSYKIYYYMGTEEDADAKKYPSYELGGTTYINMTAIAQICGMTVSGSHGSLRFGSGDAEYAEFSAGKASALVNGENVTMGKGAVEREVGSIWIPLDFAVELFSSGVEIKINDEESEIYVRRLKEEIKFSVKGATGLGPVDGDPDMGQEVDLGFKTDLSEFEQYMNPSDRDAYLVLVNKTNSIDGGYIPEKLIPIVNTRGDRAKEHMVETAEKALEAMFRELKAAGYTDVSVTSGYRSYAKQESLFNTYIARDAKSHPEWTDEQVRAHVLTYSAAPGTSEHQTGLCVDMHNLSSASVAFAEQEAYKWLSENCWKFGFVLRFPEDKVDITGYSFEPWHYRFVGRYHASAMNKRGMCLEEYVQFLNRAN